MVLINRGQILHMKSGKLFFYATYKVCECYIYHKYTYKCCVLRSNLILLLHTVKTFMLTFITHL